VPVLVQDACGFGNSQAAAHSLASLAQMGDSLMTDTKTICDLLARFTAVA
jgi:hypothetical protein